MKDKKANIKKVKGSGIPSVPEKTGFSERRKYYAALGAILTITFIVYLPVLHNSFLGWDDHFYITDNPLISSFDLKKIFSTFVMGNYHPITILTLSTEYHLFGMSERGYHAVNLLFHLANIILVFYAILLLSNKPGMALIASLLFGIHPIHVESVAWAAELKDLLYTFFFLAALICYLKYISTLRSKFYYFALILFLFSILSKAMAASFPVVLLLIDYFRERKINARVLLEKVPFFLLSLIFGVVAIMAQKTTSLAHDITIFSFPQRIVFAGYAFLTYLYKLILPIHLSAYYPYPIKNGGTIPLQYYAYVLLLFGVAAYVFYSKKTTKKILLGIGFFSISVFLVLQLMPVGGAIMADRYAYVPSIGISYLGAEGINYLWPKNLKWLAISIVCVLTVFYSVSTYSRSQIWKNDLSLWNDVISNYQTVSIAYYNRGLSYMNENKTNLALADYNKTIELMPTYTEAYVNRGSIKRDSSQYEEALNDYNKAIEISPSYATAYFNRGILYIKENKNDEAISDFTKTIELDPGNNKAYSNRGAVYFNAKRYPEAIADYSRAIALKPDAPEAYYNRAMAQFYAGHQELVGEDLKIASKLGYQPAIDALQRLTK